jgi:hypothetical protein
MQKRSASSTLKRLQLFNEIALHAISLNNCDQLNCNVQLNLRISRIFAAIQEKREKGDTACHLHGSTPERICWFLKNHAEKSEIQKIQKTIGDGPRKSQPLTKNLYERTHSYTLRKTAHKTVYH